METIKTLNEGRTVVRDDTGRLFLMDSSGFNMGEVIEGSITALLLNLKPEDFRKVEAPAPIVAGPTPPRRAPWFGRPIKPSPERQAEMEAEDRRLQEQRKAGRTGPFWRRLTDFFG